MCSLNLGLYNEILQRKNFISPTQTCDHHYRKGTARALLGKAVRNLEWSNSKYPNTQMLLHCSGNRKVTQQGCKLEKSDCCVSCIYTRSCGSLFNHFRQTRSYQSNPKRLHTCRTKDSRLFMTLWTEKAPHLVQSEAAVLPCTVLLSQASQQEGGSI